MSALKRLIEEEEEEEEKHILFITKIIKDLKRGGELLVFIRTNDIKLFNLDDERTEDNAFEGLIESATYLGDKVDYRIRAGNNLELRVQARGMSRYTRGDRVKVHLSVDRCKAITGD